MILENAAVRAAAVSSLAKFAAKVDTLRPSIQVLLKRSLNDGDDEASRDYMLLMGNMMTKDVVLFACKNTHSFMNIPDVLYYTCLQARTGTSTRTVCYQMLLKITLMYVMWKC